MNLDTRAEILKLARLLHVEPQRLSYLDRAAAADIARVRELLVDRLYEGDHRRLAGLANSSRHLPDVLVATIGERVFGPLLSADLLRIGFVLEGEESSDRVLALISDERLARLGEVAQAEGLEEEALYLYERLGERQQERMRALVPELAEH